MHYKRERKIEREREGVRGAVKKIDFEKQISYQETGCVDVNEIKSFALNQK